MYFKGRTIATHRSRVTATRHVTDEMMKKVLTSHTAGLRLHAQSSLQTVQLQVEKSAAKKSATPSEAKKQLAAVWRRRREPIAKITNPFPTIATVMNIRPRTENQTKGMLNDASKPMAQKHQPQK